MTSKCKLPWKHFQASSSQFKGSSADRRVCRSGSHPLAGRDKSLYLSDFSIEQIAEILKKPPGTIKSRLFKGRRLIKKRLEEAGYEG